MRIFKRREKLYFFPSVIAKDNVDAASLLESVKHKFHIETVPQEEFYCGIPLPFVSLVTDTGVLVGIQDIEYFVLKTINEKMIG